MAVGTIKHVYFGPIDKDTGERSQEMPTYVHQDYPKVLYHPEWDGFPFEGRTVANEAEAVALMDRGWAESPADFGVETAPSQESVAAAKIAALAVPESKRKKAA